MIKSASFPIKFQKKELLLDISSTQNAHKRKAETNGLYSKTYLFTHDLTAITFSH